MVKEYKQLCLAFQFGGINTILFAQTLWSIVLNPAIDKYELSWQNRNLVWKIIIIDTLEEKEKK